MAITEKFVGTSVLRKEDASLITGQGSFVDNLTLPGMLHLAVVRSPFAHARIVNVDVSKALEMPGVVGAWSGADLAGEWAGPLPMVWPITEDI
jgi:carbon-monoxide dehydrogenase large subunit